MKDFNELFKNIMNFTSEKIEQTPEVTANLDDMNEEELVDFLDSTWSADSLNRIARS